MEPYIHSVKYYETDKMGITHHSNYIRWMESARIDVLKQIGLDYAVLENEGIVSPVVEVSCKYKKSTTFGDTVSITVAAEEYNGLKLVLKYEMKNEEGGIVATGRSKHCFFNREGNMLRLPKEFPELHEAISNL
jgi:acyl-CoA thioester hydrolase